MKKILFILLSIAIIFTLGACSNQNKTDQIQDVSQLNGRDLGCMSGSIFDELIVENFPDSNIVYFNSRSELLLGLTTGKIDGFISDEPVALMMVNQNEQVTYLDEAVGQVEYGICFSDDAKDVLLQFDEFIAKQVTSGHLKQLQDKWINIDGSNQKKEDLVLDGSNGVLRCVTTPDAAPFSFMSNNEFQGYEVELLTEFCYEYGYTLQIDTVSFDALLTSVAMNKYDIAFNGIYITEERAKSVNFSTPTYQAKDVVMIRSGVASVNKNIFETIKDSLYKNFIEEDRYKLIISGVITTLIISSLSIITGTNYGLFLYVASMNSPLFRKITDRVQTILAKLPAVIILMLLFYVVFKTSNINGILVSIIGFSFMFGNTFYNLIKTGVNSIDAGQQEAALALGYEKRSSFFRVILPQALNNVLNPYISEVIALIKNTSIVGYVSVNDLTRSSDIIRGRTYDALFPLIVVGIFYYIICTILVWLVKIILGQFIDTKVNYDD